MRKECLLELTAAVAVWLLLSAPCVGGGHVPGLETVEGMKSDLWRNQDTEWVQWVVVNVMPARVYLPAWKSDGKRMKLYEELDPDVIDWWSGATLNRGDFFTMRGVATSSPSEYEYQEAIGPMWGYARKFFGDNGMAIRENWHWARFPKTQYGGAHMMCHIAPKWHNLVKQGMLRAAVHGDSVTQDNIGAPTTKYHPGFCVWCNRRFVEYLARRFSPAELRKMGVIAPSKFRIRDYLKTKREKVGLKLYAPLPQDPELRKKLDPEALLKDPIIREYIRFQHVSHLAQWVDCAEQAKRAAVKLGRATPAIYGNQAGCAGQNPFAVALCDHVDVVWIESSRNLQPCFQDGRQAWSTLMYKVGRAAGHFRRPVWTIQYPGRWFGEDKRTPTGVSLAEAHANGGMPVLLFSPSIVEEGKTEGTMWEVNRAHARFVGQNRVLFVDRRSVADVALVYSLACTFWRNFSSLRVDVEHTRHFTAAARLLEDEHIPYDALVFGHPDLYDDKPSLARLRRYKTLILPDVDCISDKQSQAIATYVRAGGRLVIWGTVGARDEEFRARGTPVFTDLIENPGRGKVVIVSEKLAEAYCAQIDHPPNSKKSRPVHGAAPQRHEITTSRNRETLSRSGKTSGDVQHSRFQARILANSATLSEERADDSIAVSRNATDEIAKLIAEDQPLIETDLPPTVWLNVWRHGAGPMISVQMVNYDIDLKKDTVRPVARFRIRLRRDREMDFAEARYITPNDQSRNLPLVYRHGYVEVEASGLAFWGIVAFSAAGEMEARSAMAEARKWLERLKIAKRCPGEESADDVALLAQARSLLEKAQSPINPEALSALRAPLLGLARRLRERVAGVTDRVTAQQAKARTDTLEINAVRKFDFGEPGAPDGWIEIGCDTTYTRERGFGWTTTGQIVAVDARLPDGVHRDYIRTRDPAEYVDQRQRHEGNRQFKVANPPLNPSEFRVDLPNGDYVVTVICGSYEDPGIGSVANEARVGVTYVDANDVRKLLGQKLRTGYFQNRAFRVSVTGGCLVLRFHGQNVGPFYHNTIEWLVNGVLIQRTDQKLTAAAEKSLRRNEMIAKAALRDWAVIGPFDDTDCTGLDRAFPPERSADLTASYPGKNRTVGWRRWTQRADEAPYVPLGHVLNDLDEVAGFALTHVYCERPMKAVLLASTSQTGVGYVNGELVFRDVLATGLLPTEERAAVYLRKGWNSILIKSLNHWGKSWSLWGALTTLDGRSFQGVEVSALGEQQVELPVVPQKIP